MMFWKLTYLPLKKASGFLFAACVAWGSVCSCAFADDYANCIPNKQNGQYTLECPSGSSTRNDIDANCGMTVVIVHKKATSPQSDGVSLTNNSNSDYYTSIYMHLSEILVGNGAQVKKGQVIAKSGDTNCSGGQIKTGAYGAHLHFEMRDGNGGIASGNVLDPLCNEIQSLCETQSSNIFYQNSSDYDAFQCRNCSANANGCRKTETGGYDFFWRLCQDV